MNQILKGNEEVHNLWSFSPEMKKIYLSLIHCEVSSFSNQGISSITKCNVNGRNHNVVSGKQLSISGEGTTGVLQFEPKNLNFETVLLDTSEIRKLTLINTTDCNLLYKLEVLVKNTEGLYEKVNFLSSNDGIKDFPLSLSETEGEMPARSKRGIDIFFSPTLANKLECLITWTLLKYNNIDSPSNLPLSLFNTREEEVVYNSCVVTAAGGFPTIAIQDIRAGNISTSDLWSMFSVKSLNECLSLPLDNADVAYNKLDSLSQKPELLKSFNFNFPPAAKGEKPSVIYILLKNTSQLIVDFSIKLPNDLEIEVEPWADAGEPSEGELKQNDILASQIFEITPRNGKLKPGENIQVVVSYNYSFMKYNGVHSVSSVLTLEHGKKIRINMNGVTLKPSSSLLQWIESETEFHPVFIGSSQPTLQTLKLHNFGSAPLRFSIDTKVFDMLNSSNYNFPILLLENPTGTISANAAMQLLWNFHPIEAKLYEINTTISYSTVGKKGSSFEEVITVPFIIKGRGLMSNGLQEINNNNLFLSTPPSNQLLLLPQQTAKFSFDRVSFNCVPCTSVVYRCIVLTNLSDTQELQYKWDNHHPLIQTGIIKIHPKEGKVKEGDKVVFKITLSSGEVPRNICDDIRIDCTPILDGIYMHIYIYIYAYIHTCIHTYIHTYIYA